ncbi:MAG: protease [Verrucomicrobia bacterium]|nr:protease [Verrucomicrobiota bacterium]
MRMKMFPKLFVAHLLASFLFVVTADEARLLRFPAIHGDQIVFSYAGDLYTVAATGGVARCLTSHEGYEMFPRFSPDGKWIAFTGQYDGNTEVYLMPAEGGVPKRLTYTATLDRDDVSDRMGPNNIVMTWRDDSTIVYRSRRISWNTWKGHLTLARIEGGAPEILPLPWGGWCSFSPDGKKLAYNRVFREFRTWKRYRGGQADEIWIYDFDTKTTEKITKDPAQDLFPMWHGDDIYFVSDRDSTRRCNLFVYNIPTKTTKQLTHFTDFDIKFPSLGNNAIVFENGGFIYRFDLASGQTTRVPIEIREDLAVGRGGLRDVSNAVTSEDIAPDGARAVFGARGEIFTVPAKHGPTRNLTCTPGVHERNATWSPDGKWIAYISDASGEDEVWIRPQDGTGSPVQLTALGDTYKYHLIWAPDSKRILWGDKMNRLQFVEVESKRVTLVDQATAWEITDYTWSPDSRWIAYTKPEERRFPNIYLYNLESKEKIVATDGWFDVREPEFSSDGKYLFFVSERTFNPTYGQTEWNHVYLDMAGIYLVTLAKDVKSPFAPKSDEVKIAKDDQKKEPDVKSPTPKGDKPSAEPEKESEKKDDTTKKETAEKAPEKKETEKADKEVRVKVDADGLPQRIIALPVPASQYNSLTSVGDKLYYVRKGKLFLYELDKQKETELGDYPGYRVSADKKKMLVSGGGARGIIDLPTGRIDLKDRLDLSDMKVNLDRQAEWSQIYHECWRQMRDFVYDPHLHGVDWPAMRAKYEPLLAHVQHRADLTYIIGEMIGELNLGHCYVGGGDFPKPTRVALGLLGATLVRHSPSGYYQITEILPGQNWDRRLRSPLTEIGVNVKVGDFILAVDGKPTDQMVDIYASLVGRAGKQVTLRVNSEPKTEGAHDEVVVPIDDEQPLYYLKWVMGNIETVNKATDGKIGYVHVPDMQVAGLNQFAKLYYPQLHKEGLIVDVRGNGGGNVSPQIIERLRREPAMWTIARNGAVNVDPSGQVLGPKVLLLDQFSASDGDIVAYRFRKHKLGPIIGMRSWGGVVGIRGSLPLLDGGYLNRPEFSRFDLEAREWIMEGKGVEPDIEVDNDPAREFAGIDDQLNKAIEVIKDLLAKNPVTIPKPPPYPDKSR